MQRAFYGFVVPILIAVVASVGLGLTIGPPVAGRMLAAQQASPAPPPAPPPFSPLEAAQMRAANLEVERVNALYLLATAAKEKADHAAADAKEHLTILKRDLESARPGWTIDLDSGVWTKKADSPDPKR